MLIQCLTHRDKLQMKEAKHSCKVLQTLLLNGYKGLLIKTKLFKYIFTLAIIFSYLLIPNLTHAQSLNWQENEKVAAIFSKAQTNGTFVLFDVTENKFIGYNLERAEKRYSPASTFKIPNTLIGLETGAVKDLDEIIVYSGKPVDNWKPSSSLREAIAVSNLPIYQTLASRIGLDRMQEQMNKISYGNNEIGKVVDIFWIKGPLEISAIEQTQFLALLAQEKLPFEKNISRMSKK